VTEAGKILYTRRGFRVGTALLLALALFASFGAGCAGERSRVGAITPDGSGEFTLMDFGEPLDLEALPEGWSHRTFMRHDPMDISFVAKDGRAAIRLATHDTASMLFRQVDVTIDRYPVLRWEWLIEQGIDVPHDEMTTEGDDHPARLYLSFESASGDSHSMEIIWGNQTLSAGDWKHLGFLFGLIEFPHYVANGGAANVGRWHQEQVDLREIHRELWGDPAGARLTEIALFCDTDETGASSVAYFGPISVHQR
jgi:hypothetical protein